MMDLSFEKRTQAVRIEVTRYEVSNKRSFWDWLFRRLATSSPQLITRVEKCRRTGETRILRKEQVPDWMPKLRHRQIVSYYIDYGYYGSPCGYERVTLEGVDT